MISNFYMETLTSELRFDIDLINPLTHIVKKYITKIYQEKNFHRLIHDGDLIIKEDNKEFFKLLDKKPGVYLIWQLEKVRSPTIRYVGQSGTNCGFRLYNHLVKKGKNVGSVIDKVKVALSEGHEVGVTYVPVSHQELIPFVEKITMQTIKSIQNNTPLWNIHE